MFAVLKTGGKQYRVRSGDELRIEKIAADAGEKIQFNEVLMIGGDTPVIGSPLVSGAAVQAEVIDQVKGDKVVNFVKRRRKHGSQRRVGHRQKLTLVRVTDILETGAESTGVKAAIGGGPEAPQAASASDTAAKPAAAATTPAATKPSAAEQDDLKQLSGVGPAAEKKLQEAGLTSFAQIAALNEAEIEAVETIKIKPEWIEQARELAKG